MSATNNDKIPSSTVTEILRIKEIYIRLTFDETIVFCLKNTPITVQPLLKRYKNVLQSVKRIYQTVNFLSQNINSGNNQRVTLHVRYLAGVQPQNFENTRWKVAIELKPDFKAIVSIFSEEDLSSSQAYSTLSLLT